MKRTFYMITVVLAVAMVASLFVACGGGGGGGSSSAPQSSAAYAGSSMAAVIDTTAYSSDFENLFDDIFLAAGMFEEGVWNLDTTGSSSESGSETYEGSISGTFTETWSSKYSWSPTMDESSGVYTGTYSDYADSGDQRYPGVLTGAGSMYEAYEQGSTYDPVTEDELTYNDSYYTNFDAFKETIGDYWRTPSEENRDGYLKYNWMDGYVTETWTGSQAADFSYAYAESGSDPVYVALLNASLTASYDGTATDVSTFAGTGTLCTETEGDYEFSFYGCLDFVIDVSYDGNVDEPVEPPDSGTISVSTADATATYAFGTSESNPTCIEYSVIETGASSAIFTTLVGCAPN